MTPCGSACKSGRSTLNQSCVFIRFYCILTSLPWAASLKAKQLFPFQFQNQPQILYFFLASDTLNIPIPALKIPTQSRSQLTQSQVI